MLSILPDLGSPIIRLARAKVRRGRNIVFRIDDIAVGKGEHLVLLGGNGSGKNLLASLLTGQCRESAIYVSFDKCFVPSLDVHNVSFEEQRRLLLREKRFDVSEYDKTARDVGSIQKDSQQQLSAIVPADSHRRCEEIQDSTPWDREDHPK